MSRHTPGSSDSSNAWRGLLPERRPPLPRVETLAVRSSAGSCGVATRIDLLDWVLEALDHLGGEAHLLRIAEKIWALHEFDLRQSGDLFYSWQYDYRWAATRLRHAGLLAPPTTDNAGFWRLTQAGRASRKE